MPLSVFLSEGGRGAQLTGASCAEWKEEAYRMVPGKVVPRTTPALERGDGICPGGHNLGCACVQLSLP
jgi:hypothetical protein